MSDDRRRHEASLEAAAAALAGELAPEVLERVIDESRCAAVDAVRSQLTTALVEAMIAMLLATVEPGTRRPAPSPGPPPVSTPSEGWYVYGLTWLEVAEKLSGRPGIGGTPLETVAVGRLAAVLSPMTSSGTWGVDARGELDLASLGPLAGEHERVLEEMLDLGGVLPLRFGVLFPSVDGIRRVLTDGRDSIEAELDRLAGYSEWGLTVTRAGGDTAQEIVSGGGRGYLDLRRREREAAERLGAALNGARDEMHRRLLAAAADGIVLPSTARGGRASVMRASYLVASAGSDGFREVAGAVLSDVAPELGLAGELTGPWPPYHFTDVRLDAEIPA